MGENPKSRWQFSLGTLMIYGFPYAAICCLIAKCHMPIGRPPLTLLDTRPGPLDWHHPGTWLSIGSILFWLFNVTTVFLVLVWEDRRARRRRG
jgi:hypothetical protein